MATITVRHGGDGNPIAEVTAVHIAVADAAPWTADPNDDPFHIRHNRYILKVTDDNADDNDVGRSVEFGGSSANSDFVWDDYVFPSPSDYTVRLLNTANSDYEEATASVTAE